MSTARKVPDAERTQVLLDLLHRRYAYAGNGSAPSCVVIEEVAPDTGFGQRWADALALNCWPSKGYRLDGFEVKASKADLKRELADPSKHHAVARYCNTWWLVAWDESILVDGIPDDWGILVSRDDKHGLRELHMKRQAAKRKPEPWPKGFTASLVRNASQQSAGAAFVARAVVEAQKRAEAVTQSRMKQAVESAIHPLQRALYGDNQYRWPEEARDPAKVIAKAIAYIKQPELITS